LRSPTITNRDNENVIGVIVINKIIFYYLSQFKLVSNSFIAYPS